MVNKLILVVVLIFGSCVYAQQSECKVTLANIAGSYSGGCKNGLAHGKGIAQGIDRYEGQFNKGLPDGKGTYKWANGDYYEGEWKNGKREGKGKMVYKGSTDIGYWKDDKYQGANLTPPYRIINSMSVSRSSITKLNNVGNGVKIKILQNGSDNTLIEDFSCAFDSGAEYRLGNIYGIQNTSLPLFVKVTYRSWNQLHTSEYDVKFEFVINDPGTWEVVLNN